DQPNTLPWLGNSFLFQSKPIPYLGWEILFFSNPNQYLTLVGKYLNSNPRPKTYARGIPYGALFDKIMTNTKT
ncbi:MAG: hypothetical protein ACKPKO_08325, partial [Candidatus Fonsibacter sp.]